MAECSAPHGSQAGSGNKEVDRGRGSECVGRRGNVKEFRQVQGCDWPCTVGEQ